MEDIKNRFIVVSYRLETIDGDEREVVEDVNADEPFAFISGMGMAIPAFEERVAAVEQGGEFSFTLPAAEAHGEYDEDKVIDVPREQFSVNGHFDHEHVKEGAVIPLHDAEGHYYQAEVLELGAETVRIDLNYPLAGFDLAFTGKVIENREDPQRTLIRECVVLSGEGCGCGCDHDHCDHDHDHCGHDGCGGCH